MYLLFLYPKIKLMKESVIFMMKEKIIKSIERIGDMSNKLLQTKEEVTNEELEKYFIKFEKNRMDMYDYVKQANIWLNFIDEEGIRAINTEYKAT